MVFRRKFVNKCLSELLSCDENSPTRSDSSTTTSSTVSSRSSVGPIWNYISVLSSNIISLAWANIRSFLATISIRFIQVNHMLKKLFECPMKLIVMLILQSRLVCVRRVELVQAPSYNYQHFLFKRKKTFTFNWNRDEIFKTTC